MVANFWQKSKKKNESAILRQTDGQRKMNARGSFESETEHFFFCLALFFLMKFIESDRWQKNKK